MSTDTKLTDLVVNTLTRKQYHEADLTGHGDELFVQSDHAGVFVGGNGVDALDTTNVSNCTTEIPQDISATITNGHLIVNAGSKVYFPNGSGTFDVFTLPSNFDSGDVSGITVDYMFFINNSKIGIVGTIATNIYSGTTAPVSPSTGTIWYDTANNSVKRWSGSAWVGGFSFPVAILSAGAVLKQVFNGNGNIGSHVFFLPGYSVLTPNGRNADGTLASQKYTFTACAVYTRNLTGTDIPLWVKSDGTVLFSSGVAYDPYTNTTPVNPGCAQVATATLTGGVISNFVPKQPFHAVDYSDTEFIAHQAMPSSRYTDLTLPASGGSITAPADGIFVVTKASNNSLQYLNIQTPNKNEAAAVAQSSGQNVTVWLLVSKGDVVTVYYNFGGATQVCRLIYANGSK